MNADTTTTPTPTLFTIAQVIERNRANGGHFFDPATMRAWRTRITHPLYSGPGGTYFITSDRPGGYGPRLYTVRHVADPETAGITTVGPRFSTRARAQTYARACAAHGHSRSHSDAPTS